MSGPFATYFGNQRTVAIPITPMQDNLVTVTAAAIGDMGTIVLSSNNTVGSVLHTYLYDCYCYPDITAAASGSTVFAIQVQYRTAGHANIGGPLQLLVGTAGTGGIGAGSVYPFLFYPCVPEHFASTIPATAAEITLQAQVFGIFGAPNLRFKAGWGIDVTNQGATGDIGGGGIVAQGANNPNAF